MMQQYLKIKERHQDAILFFRLGDFYEMFFEDALKASKILNITLTGRDAGQEERVPMCGVPYHSASGYIAKLINEGMKVAICEQVSDPAKSPGLVEREVVRIITPGTVIDTSMLDAGSNNYIAGLASYGNQVGLSYADVSTGTFRLTEFEPSDEAVVDETVRLAPVELVIPEGFIDHPLWEKISARLPGAVVNKVSSYSGSYKPAKQVLLDHFGVVTLDCFDCEELKAGTIAAGILLGYLKQLQKDSLGQFTSLQSYKAEGYMVIDSITRRHLELVKDTGSQKNTLFDVLNHTCTSMGKRLLKEMVQQPLMDLEEIHARLEAVGELKDNVLLRQKLSDSLSRVNDLERLASRVAFGQANTRDLLQLKSSLEQIPSLIFLLSDVKSEKLTGLRNALDALESVTGLIEDAIDPEGASSLTEGNIIKTGYNPEVDRLRTFLSGSRQWLIDLETRERERTGIKSLKVKYNKVFGYFIEVTKSYLESVPEDYIRKQTLVNCERFITAELKEFEGQALGAEDKLYRLEYELFCEIREEVARYTGSVQKNASAVSQLDVLRSLAEAAARNNYVCPRFNHAGRLKIVDGRHPVVEKSVGEEKFVPNDVYMDQEQQRIILLTGPNMSGKSTFLRQTALIVLMAQIGSFVPALEADICLTDRIFTRIGASDDISTGRSTFMVEMSEVANILHNAGERSLILLDEVGRGTATYDGLSLAWAIVEHLTTTLQAKTLFATHYHELTMLADTYSPIQNFCVAAKEVGDSIAFLHKVLPGKSDRSYGIQVAKLAGLPREVVHRAEEILTALESGNKNAPLGTCLFLHDFSEESAMASETVPGTESESGCLGVSDAETPAEHLDGTSKGETAAANVQEGSSGKSPATMGLGVSLNGAATSENVAAYGNEAALPEKGVADLDSVEAAEIIENIRSLDLQNTTPLEALNLLFEIQNSLRK